MKKITKILALVLALVMLTALVACGSPEQGGEPSGGETGGAQQGGEPSGGETGGAQQGGEPSGGETGGDEIDPEDITTVKWLFANFGSTSEEEVRRLINSINEITIPRIGVQAEVAIVGSFEYEAQMTLDMAAGVKYDIIQSIYTYPSFVGQGIYLDIADMVQEYAPDAYEMVKDYISATTLDGAVYAIPVYRNNTNNLYMTVNMDLVKPLGYTAEDIQAITTWTEFEAVMDEVYNYHNGDVYIGASCNAYAFWQALSGINLDSNVFADSDVWDALGDTTFAIHSDKEGNVSLNWAEDSFVTVCERAADWYQKGWVWEDSTYADYDYTTGWNQMMTKIHSGSSDNEATSETGYDADFTCVFLDSQLLTSAAFQNVCMGVCVNSEEPEAALMYINEMYADPVIANMLAWGEEGVDWERRDDGHIGYIGTSERPDGVYHTSDWIFGNCLVLLPWEGTSLDLYSSGLEVMQNAEVSPYFGFAVDASSQARYIATITVAKNQYYYQLAGGGYTEELYSDFMAALSSGGADKYVQFFQDSLNTWLSEQ